MKKPIYLDSQFIEVGDTIFPDEYVMATHPYQGSEITIGNNGKVISIIGTFVKFNYKSCTGIYLRTEGRNEKL